MGRGDSSWQDRKHHTSNPRSDKKPSTGKLPPVNNNVGNIETTPNGGTSVGTEGYDYTKTPTAAGSYSIGESIMNSGGTDSNETYDSSKGSKAVFTTPKKRKSSLKVNIRGAGGTGRNIV